MNKLGISQLSLRDLALLIGLVEAKRIAPVAIQFKISNSAVSYALERLRNALDDRLLIRESHGFRPTDKARKFAGIAEAFLSDMDISNKTREFDPKSSNKHFRIVATEYECQGFLKPVIKNILSSGSNIRFSFIDTNTVIELERLHKDIDLAFIPLKFEKSGMKEEFLFEDPYLTFYNPIYCKAPASIDAYCAANHAIVDSSGNQVTNIDRALGKMGLARNVKLVAPSFCSLSSLMQGSDLITTLPSSFNQSLMAEFNSCEPPIILAPMPIYLTKSAAKNADPALEFLCSIIKQQVAEMQA